MTTPHCATCSCPPNRSFPAFSQSFPVTIELAAYEPHQVGTLVLHRNADGYEATIYRLPPMATAGMVPVGELEVIARGQYNVDGLLLRELPRSAGGSGNG